jgi:DNA-binding SARP family transcriptional activator
MSDPSALHLQLAATPQALSGSGRAWTLAAQDAAQLAWLALEGPTPRQQLATLLWPDSSPEAARNSLRQRLFKLRQQLGGAEVVSGQATLALAAGVQHDLAGADTLLGTAPPVVDGPFATWLQQQRTQRAEHRRQALAAEADAAEAARDWPVALAHAHELLARDPLSEGAHRRLMRLHYLAGDRSAALLAFDRCERVLKDEIGARPSPDTLALLATLEAAQPLQAQPMLAPVPAAVQRPPRLVGREREMAALQQAWAAGHVVALVGEAGLGKTRLLQAFGTLHGDTVYAAGRPGDAGVPLATLARLLRAVAAGEAVSALPARTRGEIARVLPGFDDGSARTPGEGQRLVLLRAMQALLAAHAPRATLVVDDLHFADAASLDLLRGLIDTDTCTDSDEPRGSAAGASGHRPLRWLLAWRPADAGSAVQGLHDGLAEQARVVSVPLAPLDEAALAQLVDSLALPGVEGRAVAAGLHRRTGGNPLFVLETLKQAWVEDTLAQLADARHLPRPLAVGRLIERRIAQLSPPALTLARVAGIAGPEFSIELAESVLQVGAMQLADALNELEAAQVLRGTAFAHDLVFDAVRASVPEAIAQLTHARVASWLEPRQAEPARIAGHWLAAGRDAMALPWLARAAERAGMALRRREQIDFLDHQSRIEAALGQRAAAFDTLMKAAEVEVTLDDAVADVLSRCDRLDALADDAERRVRAATQRSNLAEMRGFHDEAEQVASAALRQALREGVGGRSLAQCRIALGTALSGQERPADALVHFEAALEWVNGHADDALRCEFHGNLATTYDRLCRLDDGAVHHARATALARQLDDNTNEAICLSNFASNRCRAGLPAEGDRLLAQAQRVYAQAAEPSSIGGFIAIEQTAAHRQMGHYTRALRDIEEGLANLQQYAPGYTAVLRAHEAGCWAHLGQWARFEQVVQALAQGGPVLPRTAVRMALLRRMGDHAHGRSGDAATLEHLLAGADTRGALDFQHSLRIELASLRADAAALHELRGVAQEAADLGHAMTRLLALARAAALGARLGQHEQALGDARAAWALTAQVSIVTGYALDPWAHCARAFVAAGDAAAAAEVAHRARQWIEGIVQDHVPPAFRDSFLHRNPFNRELLALATRA